MLQDRPDVKPLHDHHPDRQPRQHPFNPQLPDVGTDHDAQGDKYHCRRDDPRPKAPARIGKIVHVEARAQSRNDTDNRRKPQLPEKKPDAASQEHHCQRRIDFEVMLRNQKAREQARERRRGRRDRAANPPKIAPITREHPRQTRGTVLHRAEGGIIGEEHLVGKKPFVAQHREGPAKKDKQQPKEAILRFVFRVGFIAVHRKFFTAYGKRPQSQSSF